jgi:hypothetical protein
MKEVNRAYKDSGILILELLYQNGISTLDRLTKT